MIALLICKLRGHDWFARWRIVNGKPFNTATCLRCGHFEANAGFEKSALHKFVRVFARFRRKRRP